MFSLFSLLSSCVETVFSFSFYSVALRCLLHPQKFKRLPFSVVCLSNLNLVSYVCFLEEQWEKDLEAELQDYELVNDGSNERNSNWEKDVDELLEDEADLK